VYLDTALDDIGELLLAYEERDLKVELLVGICSVNVSEVLRDILVEDESADCSVDYLGDLLVAEILCDLYLDICMERNIVLVVSHESLIDIAEHLSLTGFARLIHSQVVRTEYHIL